MAYLERIKTKHPAQLQLDREDMVIGRDESCDVVIDKYEGVSRNHCGFHRYQDGVVTVTDFGSRNGTWVNGKQIFSETKLTHKDEIRICSEVQFVFIDPDSAEYKNEQRIRAKQAEKQARRIEVSGDDKMSDAMTEVSEELRNRDFKSVMSDILQSTRKSRKPSKSSDSESGAEPEA